MEDGKNVEKGNQFNVEDEENIIEKFSLQRKKKEKKKRPISAMRWIFISHEHETSCFYRNIDLLFIILLFIILTSF